MNKSQPVILVYYKEAGQYAELLREQGYTSVRTAATPEEAYAALAGTEVILCWNFPAALLSTPEAASVRWVQSIGAGIDNLVSDPGVPQHITLTRVVDQFGGQMSEYVFAFMLHHNKDIGRMLRARQHRRWDHFRTDTLEGKVIGIAGLGSIGAEMAAKARAFNMVVHGLSTGRDKAERVDKHFLPSEWNEFVQELDYLVLTLPLTSGTRHVINSNILMAMKPKACLINVGRGGLIVEEELIEVLQQRQDLTAVLDVFAKEPLDEESPLWLLPNVIVTSHLSGHSRLADVGRFFVENLSLFAKGEPLKGRVDRLRGY